MRSKARPVSTSSLRMRARTAGSRRRSHIFAVPPSWTQFGMVTARPVEDAVYGYWSAVTSTPSALARSIRAVDSRTLPQFFGPDAFVMRELDADTSAPPDLEILLDRLPALPGFVAE